MTIYNPAHLFEQLRTLGFNIEGYQHGKYRVSMAINGQRIELHSFAYFLAAIQGNLLKESAAIAAIRGLLEPIQSGEATPPMRVELDMLMHWL